MKIALEEINKVNQVQINILREVSRVCDQLNISYFMVHGSLLGTIRSESFIPYDDDIDIAIPREQYEKFLIEAPAIIDSNFFVQTDVTDKNYPLEFAKVRDNRTTYVVNSVRNINMNHGIYIDVFPIDFACNNMWNKFQEKILNMRIGCVYYNDRTSVCLKLKQVISKILCPSFKYAIHKRKKLRRYASKSAMVSITGGKLCEKEMPAEWFSKCEKRYFEGICVPVPIEYDAYLTHIYGDYKTRTLVEDKMINDKVEINACFVDIEKPYTYYLAQNW